MSILTVLDKNKETKLRFSRGSVTVLKKMLNSREARVKLTNTQLSKLKSAAKNRTGAKWRLNKKNFEDEELPHELFLIKKRTTKIRNVFANNFITDKAPIRWFFWFLVSWLRKKRTNICCYSFS